MPAPEEPPSNPAELFAGAFVQRVETLPFGAILRVHAPGETALVVVAAVRGGAGVGLLPSDARALAKSGVAGLARSSAPVEGARVGGIAEDGVLLLTESGPWVVAVDRSRRRVELRPGTIDGAVLALEDARTRLFARGEELLGALEAETIERTREALVLALERAGKRIERRIAAVGQDLARVDEANALAAQASWLVAEAARAPRGARKLAVTDWSTGEARQIELPLDPARPAREQVEALFTRARRIKKGASIAKDRLAQARARKAALATLLDETREASEHGELDVLAKRARAAAPGDFALAPGSGKASGPSARPVQQRRLAYRTFHASTGERILVGRGGADNDELTLHVARPHDLWLHARGQPGAHVVVPLSKGHTCPGEILVDAAHLAAHFSDARGELVVEVEYTPKRYVRKPRGSPPGLVVVEREKVLTLRVDEARVARLVAGETDSREKG